MSRLSEREVARKLAVREDCEPPAGLLERIKSEIPPVVLVGKEAVSTERRDAMSPRQRWLIAASLLVMTGLGFFSLRLWQEGTAPVMPPLEVAEQKAAADAGLAAPAVPAAPETRRDQMAPPAARVSPRSLPPPPPRAEAVQPIEEEERQRLESPESVVGGVEGGVPGGVPGGVVGGSPSTQPVEVPDVAPLRQEAAVAPEPAAAGRAAALSDMREEEAASSFGAVQRSLRDGRLPEPGAVRVEELVDFFADGGTGIEGAPTPFVPDGRSRLLRVTARGQEDARVELDPAVVARSRRVASGATTLYEVTLLPGVSPGERLATVHLGHRLEVLRVGDLKATWEDASPVFRLAAVAAEFAEILKGTKSGDLDLVRRRAREVAADFAGTHRAADVAELTALIEKAAGLRRGQE